VAAIDIVRTHALGPAGARQAAEDVADLLNRQLGLKTRWQEDTLIAEGKGIFSELRPSPADLRVTVDLARPMRPLRGLLESEIQRYLDRYTV
jgi:putative polyhydroxyalkanoate system protein